MKIPVSPVFLSVILTAVYKLLMTTVRVRVRNYDALEKLWGEGTPVVVALWHNELFCMPSLKVNSKWIAIVSASKDGEYLSQVLERLGVSTARGSSSRQGLAALKQAVNAMCKAPGRLNGIVTVDGPRGPRHKAKDGVIFLAQKAKAKLVPCRVRYSRKWVFEKAWDKFEIPKPFSSAEVVFGKPYDVSPEKLRGDTLQNEIETLERRLHALA